MGRIVIDPNDTEYQRHLTRMIAAFDYLRPRLRHYYTLDDDQQERWRNADQMLRRALNFAGRVSVREE